MKLSEKIFFVILTVWSYLQVFKLPYAVWTFPLTQNWFADNGLIVFKDVIYHHTPLPLFILYGMSKVLGNNFLMLQSASFLLLCFFGFGIYLTGREVSKKVGLISFLIFLISFPVLFNNFNLEEMMSSFFALYSLYFYTRFYKTTSQKFSFFFGLFLGLSFMSKQPSILILFPLTAILIVAWRNMRRLLLKFLLFMGLGIFLSILPFVLYFYFHNALSEFLYWNIIFNLTVYPSLSKPYAFSEGIYSTAWLFLSIIPTLFFIFKRKLDKKLRFLLITFVSATVFLSASLLPSFLSYKALIFYPYPVILWGFLLEKWKSKWIFLSLALGLIAFLPVFKSFYIDYLPSNLFHSEYILDYGKNELKSALWLKNNTKKQDRVMNLGNHYITTLAQRLPANRYVYIFPWLVYPYDASTREIIASKPKVVILDKNIYVDWPVLKNSWGFSKEIQKNYILANSFENYKIYVHK